MEVDARTDLKSAADLPCAIAVKPTSLQHTGCCCAPVKTSTPFRLCYFVCCEKYAVKLGPDCRSPLRAMIFGYDMLSPTPAAAPRNLFGDHRCSCCALCGRPRQIWGERAGDSMISDWAEHVWTTLAIASRVFRRVWAWVRPRLRVESCMRSR